MDASSSSTKSRTTAGILLVLFCCLLSIGRMVFGTLHPAQMTPEDIAARSGERFSLLKTRLPVEGVVGYIGESGDSALPDYYVTQYALAPLIVDHSPEHALVVGNFPSSQPSGISPDLRVVQDFGNGVLLLAGKDAK